MSQYDRATALYHKIGVLQDAAIKDNNWSRFLQLHRRALNIYEYRIKLLKSCTA